MSLVLASISLLSPESGNREDLVIEPVVAGDRDDGENAGVDVWDL